MYFAQKGSRWLTCKNRPAVYTTGRFGKDSSNNDLYWRIIRTNHDGSIRLLYAGTSPDTTEDYIGESAFNARSNRLNIFANLRKNKVFLFIVTFILVVQLIMIYFGGSIFRTTGLTLLELDITLLLAFTVIPFDFLRKQIIKKLGLSINI